MKIGFVFDDSLDKTDGIQQYMLCLAEWFTGQGHQVHYLVGETKRTDIPNVHSLAKNIKVSFNGNRLSIPLWGSASKIESLLREQRFDVLHVQMPYHPLLAGRIMRLAPSTTKIVGTFHIAPYSRFAAAATRLLGIWSAPSSRRISSVVSVSPAAQSFALQTFKRQSQVLPNAFDYHRFARARPLPEFSDSVKTIVFLGRLVQRKGCQLLLEAINIVHQSGQTGFRVVICGDGQLRSKLKSYTQQNGLEQIVTFVGRISETDKPKYFASADISVFPSSAGESFGIVLLEAMASGHSAVLGGDNPGYRSVLGSQPAQLFNPADAKALADKLSLLLANEPARKARAAWGAQESQQYDVSLIGQKLMAVYGSVGHDSSKE